MLGATLTACSGAAASDSASGSDDGAGATRTPDTRITVNLQGTKAAAGKPVTVTLADGKLKTVKVTAAEGDALTGRISGDGRTWTSDRVAAPGTEYSVEATDTGGGTDRAGFSTAAVSRSTS